MAAQDTARDILARILELMNIPAEVDGQETEDTVTLTITAPEESPVIIGKKGRTLDALQYIVSRIVHRQSEDAKRIIVDTEGYRQRRQQTLEEMARDTAEEVRSTGQPVTLDELTARERWIVHTALQAESGVHSESEGEGRFRVLVVRPAGDGKAEG